VIKKINRVINAIKESNRLTQRIRGFTAMRYINRLFTYLLTYKLISAH